MAQRRMESCWGRSEEEGDGDGEQPGGGGSVSSLHFHPGKPSNDLHPNPGACLWENAERLKQTGKPKCKHGRMGGAPPLWKTKTILPFWKLINHNQPSPKLSSPSFCFYFGLRTSWGRPRVHGHRPRFRTCGVAGSDAAGRAVSLGRWQLLLSHLFNDARARPMPTLFLFNMSSSDPLPGCSTCSVEEGEPLPSRRCVPEMFSTPPPACKHLASEPRCLPSNRLR